MEFELREPTGPEEAIRLLAEAAPGSVAVLAGGSDLLPDLDEGRSAPRLLLSLRRLPWRELRWDAETLEIGSLLPLSKLEHDAELAKRIPGLAEAVGAVGSVALRHRATLGGNLARASPVSDLIPVLLALEASVGLIGPMGERELSVEQLLRGPRQTALGLGELIRRIRVPARPCAYRWQRVRPANDISQLGVGAAYRREERAWRVATAGVAPLARRVPTAESSLSGPSPSDAQIQAAAELASGALPVRDDRRATDAYRRQLLRALVARAVRSVRDSLEAGQP